MEDPEEKEEYIKNKRDLFTLKKKSRIQDYISNFGENYDYEDYNRIHEKVRGEYEDAKKEYENLEKKYQETKKKYEDLEKKYEHTRLYIKIKNELIENCISKKDNTSPKLIMLLGAPGVGKTTLKNYLISNNFITGNNYVYLNRDDIVSKLPEYNEILNDDKLRENMYLNSGMLFMQEANFYFDEINEECLQKKCSVIIDVVGGNLGKITDIIINFSKNGYIINVIHMDIKDEKEEYEKILHRIEQRSKNKDEGGEGRSILDIQKNDSRAKKIGALKKLYANVRKTIKNLEEWSRKNTNIKFNMFSFLNDEEGHSFSSYNHLFKTLEKKQSLHRYTLRKRKKKSTKSSTQKRSSSN